MNHDSDKGALLAQAGELLVRSGFPVSDDERSNLCLLDFGLGQPHVEGLQNITLVRTDRVEVKVQILLPRQTVPQHVHPPYDNNPGKEESIRCLWGRMYVCLDGPDTRAESVVPPGKEQYYTAACERTLCPGEQTTIAPGLAHWFQGGPQGAVALSFYSRADNGHNRYADPHASFTGGKRR